MQIPDGYRKYKEQSINTMTDGEALILLFDESIKSLTKARHLCYNKDYTGFEKEVTKTRTIILELDKNLDKKYPISADLHKLYEYVTYELARLLTNRKIDLLDQIMPFLVELRDTWKEADRIVRHSNTDSNRGRINGQQSFRG